MTNLEPTTTLGQIVDQHPESCTIFERHGMDFCCGGRATLAEACAKAGMDFETITAELEAAFAPAPADRIWSEATKAELIDHILTRYHAPLPDQLAGLRALADRVANTHGPHTPHLTRLRHVVFSLAAELMDHLGKEEQILFPWILNNPDMPPRGPIQVMLMEHDSAGKMLEEIREITNQFVAPPGSCKSWTGLYAGLKVLDEELRMHIHLENNVLFPAAMA